MAKGRRSSKKKVTIEVDPETLLKLARAIEALQELAVGINMGADSEPLRRELLKKGKMPRREASDGVVASHVRATVKRATLRFMICGSGT